MPGSAAPIPNDNPQEAGRKVGGVLNQEAERSDRLEAQNRISTLQKVTVDACQWDSIDPNQIRPYGRNRADSVPEGYRCDYEVFHDTETRGLVSAKGSAYFFHRGGSYDFGNIEVGSFELVDCGG